MGNESKVLIVVSDSRLARVLVAALEDVRATRQVTTLKAGAEALASREHPHCAVVVHVPLVDGDGWKLPWHVHRWPSSSPVLYVLGPGESPHAGRRTVRSDPLDIGAIVAFVRGAVAREDRRDARMEAGVRWLGIEFGLSEQLRRVVRMIADGCAHKLIAEKLALKEDTVHSHLKNIRSKTGMSTTEMVSAVREVGLGEEG